MMSQIAIDDRKKKKLSHSYVKVKKDNVENLDLISDIIKKTGNLVPTVSWLLYSYICKEIDSEKKNFKVVLTGTGGDEIFADIMHIICIFYKA